MAVHSAFFQCKSVRSQVFGNSFVKAPLSWGQFHPTNMSAVLCPLLSFCIQCHFSSTMSAFVHTYSSAKNSTTSRFTGFTGFTQLKTFWSRKIIKSPFRRVSGRFGSIVRLGNLASTRRWPVTLKTFETVFQPIVFPTDPFCLFHLALNVPLPIRHTCSQHGATDESWERLRDRHLADPDSEQLKIKSLKEKIIAAFVLFLFSSLTFSVLTVWTLWCLSRVNSDALEDWQFGDHQLPLQKIRQKSWPSHEDQREGNRTELSINKNVCFICHKCYISWVCAFVAFLRLLGLLKLWVVPHQSNQVTRTALFQFQSDK